MRPPMTTPPLDLTQNDLDTIRLIADGGSRNDVMTIKNTSVLALLDRVEAAEFEARRDGALLSVANGHVTALRKAREEARVRVTAAEAAISRVEALCQDTDGNWLDPEDECNNVGGILQAVHGDGA